AGFPTETEDMFANSMSIVEDCGLSFLHVFPFSPRPGTPAARMPQLDRAAVKERAARLRMNGSEALRAHLAREVGQSRPILMETGDIGRTPQFASVYLQGGRPAGEIVVARLTAHDGERLTATAI
ncbi:MAG: tRNA (N(6)-L-threonylcarbamoyladenosine(37)-C(2))-methylthiotransferase MtaB, partial [Pseudomonadota bacterium]|nr:tRNA (N(6)-L-threonylcarbamoyladenosine(37)-C(2))-methylthiotransferase MtaB [Pseudomonadota bacterium]